MSTSNMDNFGVHFTGKNYSSWEFQFRLFVIGKELWGHIDGSKPAPKESSKLAEWQVKDSRVMTWILGSIDQSLVPNLRPYKTAKDMWGYLKKVYNQDNTAKRFQLEYDLARYSQGDLSIQDFYSGFQNLWAEYVDMIYVQIPPESLVVVENMHAQSKRDQFLMKLQLYY